MGRVLKARILFHALHLVREQGGGWVCVFASVDVSAEVPLQQLQCLSRKCVWRCGESIGLPYSCCCQDGVSSEMWGSPTRLNSDATINATATTAVVLQL